MADDHVFSFLDVFSFQFAKEILRYPGSSVGLALGSGVYAGNVINEYRG